MTDVTATQAPPTMATMRSSRRLRRPHDPRISRSLVVGLLMLLALAAFSILGPLFVDPKQGVIGAAMPRLQPTAAHLLGTDTQGRDLWTIMVLGTPNSLKIGLIAGFVGVGIGLVLGLLSGFVGGATDTVIRLAADALLTVPVLAILVIVAANVDKMTVEAMGFAVAMVAWMFPTRVIRSQVLSLRERSYVEVARANGVGTLGLIFREVMPNVFPWVVAAFVGAVAGAILAAVGLEALGLGANDTHTLGVNIYWATYYAAVGRGMWWWWLPPILMIAFIFLALYITSAGMDRIANPRLRRA
jgi:peptide/nickel transport system permease protein